MAGQKLRKIDIVLSRKLSTLSPSTSYIFKILLSWKNSIRVAMTKSFLKNKKRTKKENRIVFKSSKLHKTKLTMQEEASLPQLFSLFSPSDTSKKLSHHFLVHLWINIGYYDHHAKYQGVFMGLLWNNFFIRVPLWIHLNLLYKKGGPLWKKCFIKAP